MTRHGSPGPDEDHRRPTPPALATWVLERALRSEAEREMVLGDLHEDFARYGSAWYWRQALSIAAHARTRSVPASGGPRMSGDSLMSTLMKDVRYAWRALFKRPLLTLTVATTLAVGLGANAAIFNLIDRLILRPYPLEDPDGVVLLSETGPRLQDRKEAVSPANFFDWRAQTRTLTFVSAYAWWDANLVERGDPERLPGFQITSGFFEAMRVQPAVIAEISIALPLLVAAGLGVLGTRRFLTGPQGYDPDGVLTMKVVLPERVYPDDASRRQFVANAIDALHSIAGVEQAAAINNMPTSGSNSSRTIEIEGHPAPDSSSPPSVDFRNPTAEYFSTLRIPVLRGRNFTSADRDDAAPVAIISDSMARKFWPNEEPIGRRLRVVKGPWLTVVGVSGDVIHDWFNRRNTPVMYRPFRQAPTDYSCLVIRTAGDPASVAPAARRALLGVDPDQPVFEVMTMRRALHERTIGLQYLSAIMTVFAAMALLLASVGLYALITYLVAQRRHEIGVRIALGASASDVVWLTVGQSLRLTLSGAAIGLVLSIALSRLMEAGMLGVATSDARVFAGFAAVLIMTALLAGYLPARRAAAIDPITALRVE